MQKPLLCLILHWKTGNIFKATKLQAYSDNKQWQEMRPTSISSNHTVIHSLLTLKPGAAVLRCDARDF